MSKANIRILPDYIIAEGGVLTASALSKALTAKKPSAWAVEVRFHLEECAVDDSLFDLVLEMNHACVPLAHISSSFYGAHPTRGRKLDALLSDECIVREELDTLLNDDRDYICFMDCLKAVHTLELLGSSDCIYRGLGKLFPSLRRLVVHNFCFAAKELWHPNLGFVVEAGVKRLE